MAKFWNLVVFQLAWFACVLGAANQEVFWAVIGSLAYIIFHIWRSPSPKMEISLLFKVFVFGLIADSLIMRLGYLDFHDSWPSPYLSPLWMWVLWVLVGTTINHSLAWLRGKPVWGAILGAICGPISYEAGIRMGAGAWTPGGQIVGFILVAVVWALAIPLFFYWDRTPIERGLVKNP